MPLLNTRNARRAPSPQNQPTDPGATHTLWHPHKLVDGAMNSPFLLGFILFSAALAMFLSRRRMRNWISRIVSQAIEVANAPSLHIHIYGHSQASSNDYATVPDSPSTPEFTPFSPSTQYPPTSGISDPSPINRSVHIDVTPRRQSTVKITHIPIPSKMDNHKATTRGSLTSIIFYPDSPTSTPSTPALSECDALSPRSETMPLTPRMSFEEDVKVALPSPSPSPSVFSSSTCLDSFRIQTPVQVPKPAPNSVPDAPTITTERVARSPSPTMMVSIHTTLPSHMIARARGSTAPVPPNIVLTSVPRRPSQPEAPLSPPHMLTVPNTRSLRRQQPQQPRRHPTTPPVYKAPKSTMEVWTHLPPATALDPLRPRNHTRQHTQKRPLPPPKPIIPLDLEPVYPPKDTEAEVTPTNPGPAFALRRPLPPVKPVIPFDLEPVYQEEKRESGQIRSPQYDEHGDEEVESPTSATMFFKALVEKGKREMQSLRKEMEEGGREERKWGGINIGARMSAFAKRARRVVERELDSEDDEEFVTPGPDSPVFRSGWPSSIVGTAQAQGVVMPLSVSEVRKAREMVFVIGDEEDL